MKGVCDSHSTVDSHDSLGCLSGFAAMWENKALFGETIVSSNSPSSEHTPDTYPDIRLTHRCVSVSSNRNNNIL